MVTDAKGKAVTTKSKEKTKATGAKENARATGLKEFLSNLATDPRKLGEFLHEPEDAMSSANLSEEDKTALRSGVAGMVAARLAGVPLDQAFLLLGYQKVAPVYAPMIQMHYVCAPPSAYQKLAALPASMIHYPPGTPEPAYSPPQYVIYPPQFVVQPPPQYVAYPPQFVVQPPPQYVAYPPQFVVQPPPPQYVAYPPQFVVQPPPSDPGSAAE
jgi:hypothetical protein